MNRYNVDVRPDLPLVGYFSHPLGPWDNRTIIKRLDNIAGAGKWLDWLTSVTQWTVCWPWMPYIVFLPELRQQRAFSDQLRIMGRCDFLIQCGCEITTHMALEEEEARSLKLPVVNFTDLGEDEPPRIMPAKYGPRRHLTHKQIAQLVQERCDRAMAN